MPRVTASSVKVRTGGTGSPEAQGAVRIVLDDHEAVPLGQFGQVAAPIQGERAARRVLEVRDDVADACRSRGQLLLQQVRAQAVPVRGHGHDPGVAPPQRLQRADVGRRLDDHVIAGIDDRPRQQIEALL